MGKPPQKCIELGIALREIFRYIRYQFNELEWNLLMAGGNLTHLMADKQMALPGDKESQSCLFLWSRHFTPCQMDLRDILLAQPRLSWPRKLEAEGTCHPVVKLSSWHSAKSQYHKLSPLNVDLE